MPRFLGLGGECEGKERRVCIALCWFFVLTSHCEVFFCVQITISSCSCSDAVSLLYSIALREYLG
jgi:hypothetical protein